MYMLLELLIKVTLLSYVFGSNQRVTSLGASVQFPIQSLLELLNGIFGKGGCKKSLAQRFTETWTCELGLLQEVRFTSL